MMKEFARWLDTHAEALRWSAIGFFTSCLLNDLSNRNHTSAVIDAVLIVVNLFPFKGSR